MNLIYSLKKLSLKEKSNLRVKHWPNTLEAKRKKKDEARFERFKAEEVNYYIHKLLYTLTICF